MDDRVSDALFSELNQKIVKKTQAYPMNDHPIGIAVFTRKIIHL